MDKKIALLIDTDNTQYSKLSLIIKELIPNSSKYFDIQKNSKGDYVFRYRMDL